MKSMLRLQLMITVMLKSDVCVVMRREFMGKDILGGPEIQLKPIIYTSVLSAVLKKRKGKQTSDLETVGMQS
ncbi:hypothetical protein DVQ19_06975 [Yersinia enterocolitica]|nr:hypothetical protein [Yersinia enterocolitica]EKN6366481.1 hypothetical protein [Yersinia enterocolitica]